MRAHFFYCIEQLLFFFLGHFFCREERYKVRAYSKVIRNLYRTSCVQNVFFSARKLVTNKHPIITLKQKIVAFIFIFSCTSKKKKNGNKFFGDPKERERSLLYDCGAACAPHHIYIRKEMIRLRWCVRWSKRPINIWCLCARALAQNIIHYICEERSAHIIVSSSSDY